METASSSSVIGPSTRDGVRIEQRRVPVRVMETASSSAMKPLPDKLKLLTINFHFWTLPDGGSSVEAAIEAIKVIDAGIICWPRWAKISKHNIYIKTKYQPERKTTKQDITIH